MRLSAAQRSPSLGEDERGAGSRQRGAVRADKMAALQPGGGAARRVRAVLGHLSGPGAGAVRAVPCGSRAVASSPEDVVVVHGRRTAIGRAKRGGFKVRQGSRSWSEARHSGSPHAPDLRVQEGRRWRGSYQCSVRGVNPVCLQDTTPDELLSAVMTAVLQDVRLRPEVLGDICVGERWVLRSCWWGWLLGCLCLVGTVGPQRAERVVLQNQDILTVPSRGWAPSWCPVAPNH